MVLFHLNLLAQSKPCHMICTNIHLLVLVQSLSHVWLFAAPWTAACQASLSNTNSQSLLKLMSIESVISSNHLIHCCLLLLLPSIFPSIRIFSNESFLLIRWPKDWSFENIFQNIVWKIHYLILNTKLAFIVLWLNHWASQVALVVKNLPSNAGEIRDLGSIPESERSFGGEHGNPPQYSCLENPMSREAYSQWGHKESDMTEMT